MTSTNCSLTTRDFMLVVMRLFDNTVAREPTALQQGDARKDETMPDADASLSLSRQHYVTGGMFFQAMALYADWLVAVGERRP